MARVCCWAFLITFLCCGIQSTDALGCYSCTNVTAMSMCKGTMTCASADADCPSKSPDLVGRSASQDHCISCCNTDNCNRQLCQPHDPSCVDNADFDCPTIGATINICDEPHRARTYCKNFCGLCSLRDGAWSSWSAWSDCSVSCGNGTQDHSRTCSNPAPWNGGDDCVGTAHAVQTCSMKPCPVHGGWTSWSTWGSCSVTCDVGLQRRDRYCGNPYPSADGSYCTGDTRDDKICVMPGCTNGGWSAWAPWGACSRTCGDGIQSRSRTCDNPIPSISGRSCAGDSGQTQLCRVRNCHDGGWSAWASWGACSRTCGDGVQSRSRSCDNPVPSISGRNCAGDPAQTQTCKIRTCNVHGGWTSWSAWGSCSVTCDVGLQRRDRYCGNPYPSADGSYCMGDTRDDRICVMPGCTNGGWSAWAPWGACSRTCGDGVQSRSRYCDNPVPSISGRNCAGDSGQTQSCRVRNCHDGGWSAWASWGSCSRTCGDGIQSRSRTCDNPVPSISGRNCVGDPVQAQSCKVRNCHDGGWSAWASWGSCSRTCGDGIQSRSRTCDNPVPSISGRNCVGDPVQAQSCKVRNCHAKVSAFTVKGPKGDGQPLHFSTTVFNEGSNFNAWTGKFTCSIPGVYFFALSLVKIRSYDDSVNDLVQGYIRQNGHNKVSTEIDPSDLYADYGSYGTSATVTLRLQTGDVVDVTGSNSNYMSPHTMFSGFLIQPDEP